MKVETIKNTNEISYIQIAKDKYYKIANSNHLRPFFMNIVSSGNHWMFISSNGGLSAGRKNAQYALFPYYTDDKITESADITGSKSIFQVQLNNTLYIWEPFSYRYEGKYRISRNLYKNIYGNKILFEEINHDLKLTFRYSWNSSNNFGFVKKSTLINNSLEDVNITVLDGIQNILPYGVNSDLQNQVSNLVDAYKRNELLKGIGLGIFSLSAIIVDKAEPSEALKANIAWSLGFDKPKHLLSSSQLKNFRKGLPLVEEIDIKAEKGAYFINQEISLYAKSEKEWMIIANVNQNHAAIAQLSEIIKHTANLEMLVKEDIDLGTKNLIALNAASDGLQLTSDKFRDTRHFSNVLFNIMRGGIFDHNYEIEKRDFSNYLFKANKTIFKNVKILLEQLPNTFSLSVLKKEADKSTDVDFRRLCTEYLPLKFSRRHGDPSRPWNKFSINTLSEIDGSRILDYQGNWRDIFQNWEALAHSYPEFMESMIYKFLNASTFDGYNPYRVTKDGFDWETIEPDNPWSYIGYWGDHQIIYLLKFLEFIEKHAPTKLAYLFDKNDFVYANVPYKIKPYLSILDNPKDTIEFDHELDKKIRQHKAVLGADAALVHTIEGEIYRVNFIEKILATILAKVSNFIPEAGIWMNTQRPEWNDANNALVGNGVSMVTLYYLHRFLHFFKNLFSNIENDKTVEISSELALFYKNTHKTLHKYEHLLVGKINDKNRKLILDELGQAASDYRHHIYIQSFEGKKDSIVFSDLKQFLTISLKHLEHSIKANKRTDNLYHAYNLMTVENEAEISISYLDEMLEGQVAVLSSGYLSSQEALDVLDALKNSALFRHDQYSYLLYPNKDLPRFMEKNNIPKRSVKKSKLLSQLINIGNVQIIEKDVSGNYHFNGNFKNANDLNDALEQFSSSPYQTLLEQEKQQILDIFEAVFNHKAFTGRSGTFFGYEGLGSIYWHMVSKLQLAVQEGCLKAIEEDNSPRLIGKLLEHYYEINEGIGVHKSPSLYGAFPTDPYSHTPAGKGAQQPGMTGQVKEDILCRFGELGVFVKQGQLYFNPCLLRTNEFLKTSKTFNYVDIHSNFQQLELEQNSLCFTYCQVPIIYKISSKNRLEIFNNDNTTDTVESLSLSTNSSQEIFRRTGTINKIIVYVQATKLK